MLKEHIQYVFLISRKICHISRQWSAGGLWSQVTLLYSFAEHLRLGSSTITVCISDDLTLLSYAVRAEYEKKKLTLNFSSEVYLREKWEGETPFG